MILPPHPRGYVCVKAKTPPKMTGKLDDPVWKDAPWTLDFVDIEGDIRPKPWFKTRAKMLWDANFFYIGAELEEPNVWATLTQHDSVIFQDNDFEVFIDPDGDNHNYYEYEINAFGTDWDLRLPKPYRDGGPALNEWEIPGLKKAVFCNGTINDPSNKDIGWSLELAIPWKVLGEFAKCQAPPRPGDQWRVNFSRVEWDLRVKDGEYEKVPDHPEHNWVWSPQGAVDMHRPEMWGYVQFEEEMRPFKKDPFWETKTLLMAGYWAQKQHLEKHGGFATTVEELGPGFSKLFLEEIPGGYRLGAISHGVWTFVQYDSLMLHGK